MENQTKVSQYKIGDYARYMGVTPDLLKHYEQHGLVTPEVSPSGYRYYPFTQSPALLSSMGLRSYGLPLREISAMLQQELEEKGKQMSLSIRLQRQDIFDAMHRV